MSTHEAFKIWVSVFWRALPDEICLGLFGGVHRKKEQKEGAIKSEIIASRLRYLSNIMCLAWDDAGWLIRSPHMAPTGPFDRNRELCIIR